MERAFLSCRVTGAAAEVAPGEQGLLQDEAMEVKSGQPNLQVSFSQLRIKEERSLRRSLVGQKMKHAGGTKT